MGEQKAAAVSRVRNCDIKLSSFQAAGAFPCADALSSFKLSLPDIATSVSR